MTVPTTNADLSPTTKNPYERAMWLVATALLLGSVTAIVWAQDVFHSNRSWTDTPPADFQIAQVIFSIAPSSLTGGVLLAGMALAIRAIAFNRRTPDPHLLPTSTVAPAGDPVSAVTVPSMAEREPMRSAPVDHTPYMRPQGGKSDS